MKITARKKGGAVRLKVEGDLTIYSAAEAKKAAIGELEKCGTLELDLSGVSEMDTAGFQIILLMRRECKEKGKGFAIASCSGPVRKVMELFNVEEYFGFLNGRAA